PARSNARAPAPVSRAYSALQTTGNAAPGGCQLGLSSSRYQREDTSVPILPAAAVAATAAVVTSRGRTFLRAFMGSEYPADHRLRRARGCSASPRAAGHDDRASMPPTTWPAGGSDQ